MGGGQRAVCADCTHATGVNLTHRYNDAVMRLDLCDREGKYSNGFCHWPQPAWRKPDGTWVHAPAPVLFTAPAAAHALVLTSSKQRCEANGLQTNRRKCGLPC